MCVRPSDSAHLKPHRLTNEGRNDTVVGYQKTRLFFFSSRTIDRERRHKNRFSFTAFSLMVVLLPYILYCGYMFDQALAGLACSLRINQKVTMTADCLAPQWSRCHHLLCALLAGPFELSPDFSFVDIFFLL